MENPSDPPVLLRVCPSCNSRIEPDHTFCEICGAKMPDLPTCNHCGALFIAPVKFCERCGTMVNPQEKQEPAAGGTPEPGYQPESPDPIKPSLKKSIPVPALSGPDLSDTVDDALFLLSEGPEPVKRKADMAHNIRGIFLLIIFLAVVFFIGLPMLNGNGLPGLLNKPAAADTILIPESTLFQTILPTLPETPTPIPLSDALAPKPTQLVPDGQEVHFGVRKDPTNAKITIILAEGPWINSISSAEVKVTHPDGSVTSGIIFPFKGATEIILAGSRETDRVEIIAKMTDSRTYRVFDDLV